MRLEGLSIDFIKNNGVLKNGNYRIYLGDRLSVLESKSGSNTKLLSSELSYRKHISKYMMKYFPNNRIHIDEDLVKEGDIALKSVSCFIDSKSCSVFIGKLEKYSIKEGVLVISTDILDNTYQYREIYYSNIYNEKDIFNKVNILALGYNNTALVGLILIPNDNNIDLNKRDDYNSLVIEDWFENSLIRVL